MLAAGFAVGLAILAGLAIHRNGEGVASASDPAGVAVASHPSDAPRETLAPMASDGAPAPSVVEPSPTVVPSDTPNRTAIPATGPFPGGILIADRANARIIVVNNAGRIV